MRDRYLSVAPATRKRRSLLLGLPILALVGLLALQLFGVGGRPALELATSVPGIGRATHVTLTARQGGRGLGGLRLELLQGDLVVPLGAAGHRPRAAWKLWGPRTVDAVLEADIDGSAVDGLREGPATLRASAERAGTWLRHPADLVIERELPVRLRPPSVQVLSGMIYAAQGGSEAVVYRVGEQAARHGVRAGDAWFPGFELPGGGPGDRFVLFGVPYDLDDPSRIRLVVADDLGNEAAVPFLDRFTPKPLRRSTIELSDAFLEKVVPAIAAQTPEVETRASLLDTYLEINRDLRARNAQQLLELGADTAAELLWHGAFRQQPNTQVMDQFAAARTYRYDGREVDRQVHLGFDLASVRQAEVLAANRGRVLMARYFGIYGNAVVLDHGYGLETLYAHLSSIAVEPGQTVDQGAVLGRTGDTGLAGGDHLHFTTMIRGVMVDPSEWLDAHWIHDRLQAKLGEHLGF